MRLSWTLGVSCLAGVLASHPSRADEPLRAPTAREVCSRDGKYCAFMDPHTGTKAYEMNGSTKGKEVWSMQGWFRVAALADDGKHLVVGWDGMNLVPKQPDPKLVMIRFYESGKSISEVHLDELIQDLSKLKRTVSHEMWGDFPEGLDARGLFVVHTVEGRMLAFDPATGRVAPAGGTASPTPASPMPAPPTPAATPPALPAPAVSTPPTDGGHSRACGCRIGESSSDSGALAALGLGLAALLLRRGSSGGSRARPTRR
jgi:MYXO-CTERM domain-containing protein